MRILISNCRLRKVGGTENYTYALAVELLRRGHEVEYFTFLSGEISERLKAIGVPFMNHAQYDLILSNHIPTVKRLCYKGYLIQTCHGTIPRLEQPCKMADAHVAVTKEVSDYLNKKGYPNHIILNGIDCQRFEPCTPISPTLKRVLSLCQSDEANNFLRACCEKAGVEFSQLNKHTDNVWAVEEQINQVDLVVGIGRSLYDAMACGRCVISYDHRIYMKAGWGDGYLSAENIETSIRHNCSGRGLHRTFTEAEFIEELKKYNPADGVWARQYALEHLNIEKAVDAYLEYASSQKNQDKEHKTSWLYSFRRSILRLWYRVKYKNADNRILH